MDCEHEFIEGTIPFEENGYMTVKFCVVCREASGYGFLNKQHEEQYLNALWNVVK